MAFKFNPATVRKLALALNEEIASARYRVRTSGGNTWYTATEMTKLSGADYVQVEIALDHSKVGTGTVNLIQLRDAGGAVVAQIDANIYRATATDDILFRAKIGIEATLL